MCFKLAQFQAYLVGWVGVIELSPAWALV